ncbi:uncharacterized protein LOC124147326 [Haliotis rufescens]|uniref:uncharacterized protein LOC124147326 n=1 Tax=Haliotis rufescens TaxID=6454 RepID=UPI00201E9594|nr:uncharacterized protein LOC124147326 [Haliotis rufescens]
MCLAPLAVHAHHKGVFPGCYLPQEHYLMRALFVFFLVFILAAPSSSFFFRLPFRRRHRRGVVIISHPYPGYPYPGYPYRRRRRIWGRDVVDDDQDEAVKQYENRNFIAERNADFPDADE